ncbi:MAG: hypothetical protein WCJ63_02505 [Actinomycetes bacterium]
MSGPSDLQIVIPDASPDEAAAIVASIEQFMRQTAPASGEADTQLPAWQRASLLEGVERDPRSPGLQFPL